MADSEPKPQTENVEYDERRLKYLDFVQMAAIYMVICFSTLYEFAKENSGPLRPGVQTVEATVRTVVGPLYDRFQHVPFEALRFIDSKVDEYVHELDSLVPSLVKQASTQARAMASEVQRAGFADAARSGYKRLEPAAREMYGKCEPVAEEYAVAIWRRLNGMPLFPQVAEIAVPTVAYWAEKYNRAVCYAAERDYPVSGYLPLVPLDRIAKAFDEAERGPAAANGEVATAQ
ncbi:stress-related protein [Rhodamnia argentea]|uniref:Stress-related protein n=1 Tax=Rhodamnia argentea TaxID=178133 RepID=A0A8B8PD51_9MYRT|nr:stress-related protein [Rhodamnia argentea]